MSSGLRLKKTSVTEGEHDSRVVRVLKGGGLDLMSLCLKGKGPFIGRPAVSNYDTFHL
jgi:hypothetical protein